jgi:DNA invertase Pin-like site-specific DNA recombinase
MIQDAQRHQFDAIVVHKLDRFARSVVVALGTFKLLNDLGIAFLSLSEQGMDFTSPMGKIMFGMFALLAEYYSENLGNEVRKGKAERRAKGLHNGLVPFGYRSIDGGVAEPDAATRDGAIMAFDLAAKGHSLAQIVRTLNERGYRTAGNMRRGLFTKDTVRDMLANRFYLGQLPVFEPGTSRRVRGWERGQHSSLIDCATFEAARTAIEGRATAMKTRRSASIYSVSGLLRCSHCGERMRAVRPPNGRIRYHCRSKAQGIGCTGGGSFLDVYEAQLLADLSNFVLPGDWRQLVLDAARQLQEHPDDGVQQRQQLQSRLERLRELYGWGDLSREQYLAERQHAERELTRLVPAANIEQNLNRIADYVVNLPRAWADADQEQRNRLASLLYEELWVDGPILVYVKPRPEAEPLFQVRAGAAQPTPKALSERSNLVRSYDPDGNRPPHLPSSLPASSAARVLIRCHWSPTYRRDEARAAGCSMARSRSPRRERRSTSSSGGRLRRVA